jgi:hypothetical protein
LSGMFKDDHLAMMRALDCPQFYTACPSDGTKMTKLLYELQ